MPIIYDFAIVEEVIEIFYVDVVPFDPAVEEPDDPPTDR
jgi:hypothetical protein